jgi:hypothetical protein
MGSSPVAFVLASLLGVPALGQISLPGPTGPFPVGRISMEWTDSSRLEDAGPTAGKPREVLAYIYYPAIAVGKTVDYFPGLGGLEDASESRYLRQQFGVVWNLVTSGAIRTNVYDAPPLPAGKSKFPVLVFSPGALAPVLAYQLQLQELASRGYVVFGLEHGTDSALLIRPDRTLLPYVSRSPPDQGPPTTAGLEVNRDQVIRRTADIVFVLNQIEILAGGANGKFSNRLDLSRIGVFGHSMGGKAAIRACQVDRRVRTCANQDGEMFGIPFNSSDPIPSLLPERTITVPVAVIYVAEPGVSDAQLAAAKVTRAQYEDWREAKNRALRRFLKQKTKDSTLITITVPGFVHASFMDIRLLGARASSEDVRNHRTAVEIATQYFDAKLHTGDQNAWRKSSLGARVAIESVSGPDARR